MVLRPQVRIFMIFVVSSSHHIKFSYQAYLLILPSLLAKIHTKFSVFLSVPVEALTYERATSFLCRTV